MIQIMKDKAISKAAEVMINKYIAEYGKINKITLNSKDKSILLEIMLDGEIDVINVNIENYKVTEDSDVILNKISTSKPWLTTLAQNYIENKKFKIPLEYSKIVKGMI